MTIGLLKEWLGAAASLRAMALFVCLCGLGASAEKAWAQDANPDAAKTEAAQPDTAAEAAKEAPKAEAVPAETTPAEAPAAKAADDHAKDDHTKDDHATGGHDDAHADDKAHSGGHGHDTTDLSHANAGPELNSPAEFRLQLAVGTVVVFGALLLLLGKFAWGPIASGLDAREASIANMIAEAKRNQEETAAQLKLYESKLQRAADEAREVVNQARREAEGVASKIVTEAQAQATAEKDRAVAEIRGAKNAALSEIAQRSVNTAVSLAGNLIRREVRPEDHEAMIQESLNQFRQN